MRHKPVKMRIFMFWLIFSRFSSFRFIIVAFFIVSGVKTNSFFHYINWNYIDVIKSRKKFHFCWPKWKHFRWNRQKANKIYIHILYLSCCIYWSTVLDAEHVNLIQSRKCCWEKRLECCSFLCGFIWIRISCNRYMFGNNV